MSSTIWYENKFGEQAIAGKLLETTTVDGELYELMALSSDICDSVTDLAQLELMLNLDKREGYAIYPIRDSYGHYVWYHYNQRLVLCLARGLWG